MFFSQHFSFPLSVSFHHCSILIHPFTTHALKYFSFSTSVFPCQYHSTIAPYSFIHFPSTLYNVFLLVHQFSRISIIPPLLHTHSSIYHPRCIIFFSQHSSFPLSLSFHHCSILIHPSFHPSIYHPRCIMLFSQHSRFPLSVPFHHCSITIHPSTTHAV